VPVEFCYRCGSLDGGEGVGGCVFGGLDLEGEEERGRKGEGIGVE